MSPVFSGSHGTCYLVGPASACYKSLASVYNIMIAVLYRGCPYICDIGASFGLGNGKGGYFLPGQNRLYKFLFLLISSRILLWEVWRC